MQVYASHHFEQWLEHTSCSLALTTYQTGKMILLGRKPDGTLSAHERLFPKCQGLWSDGQMLWLSSLFQLWHFEAVPSQTDGYDREFFPRRSYITGGLDIHDIGMGEYSRPIFVNTRYNCLATISPTASFEMVWKPPFITSLVSEDRCHLNGLAMNGTKPAYVTAHSRSDVQDGWRDRRSDGGIVVSVQDNAIVTTGLSMPHSPRLYDGKLWVLNSGAGEFGHIDLKTGKFIPVTFCPGYARGLSFIGDYAVIGLSLPRGAHTFEGLPLDAALKTKDTPPRCGLIVVDLNSGEVKEWMRIEGVVTELYDVAVLPNTLRPRSVGVHKIEEVTDRIILPDNVNA